jgi:sigma-B regulation protein RsbU (phosphoserine phosphatase)
MAAVRSSLRTNIRHRGTDLTTLFREVNRDLVRDTGEDKFVTLFYGILDDADHSLTWASGGHDPALWRHADTGEIEELPNTGMLMGIFEDVAFEQADPVHLHSGDVAVIGTDGIWEARGPDGSLFGKERLYKILRETRGSAQETCAAIVAAVTGFCGPVPQQDDITLIVVQAL